MQDYEFYVTLTGTPCNSGWGGTDYIMGSFPSRNSLPFTLASKFASGPVGVGIVTLRPSHPLPILPSLAWPLTKSYLSLAYDSRVTHKIIWSPPPSPPNAPGQDVDYDLQAIPGFSFTVTTPDGGSFSTRKGDQWRATVDTGAPQLTSRVGPANPQRKLSSSYQGPCNIGWMSPSYAAATVCLSNANVTVAFTGLTSSTSYSFATTAPGTGESPNEVILADWSSSVPWAVGGATPATRFNLGNTIYIYCPVVYYNYSSMSVGVAPCSP